MVSRIIPRPENAEPWLLPHRWWSRICGACVRGHGLQLYRIEQSARAFRIHLKTRSFLVPFQALSAFKSQQSVSSDRMLPLLGCGYPTSLVSFLHDFSGPLLVGTQRISRLRLERGALNSKDALWVVLDAPWSVYIWSYRSIRCTSISPSLSNGKRGHIVSCATSPTAQYDGTGEPQTGTN